MCLYYVYCFYVVLGLGSGHTNWGMSDTCAVCPVCHAMCHFFSPHQSKAVNLEQRPGSHCIAGWLCPTLLRGSSMWLMKRESPLMGKDCIRIDIDRYWGFTRCSHVLGLLSIQESMQLMFFLGRQYSNTTLHIKQLPCWRLFLAGVEGKCLKLWHPRLPESNFTKSGTLALGLGM